MFPVISLQILKLYNFSICKNISIIYCNFLINTSYIANVSSILSLNTISSFRRVIHQLDIGEVQFFITWSVAKYNNSM